MTYEIRTAVGGTAEIIQTRSFGFYDDPAIAERVLALLIKDENPVYVGGSDGTIKPLETDPPAATPKQKSEKTEHVATMLDDTAEQNKPKPRKAVEPVTAPLKSLARAPAPVVPKSTKPATKAADIEPVQEIDPTPAFARIKAGEKIADVAPDFGMTMYQLRSKWAQHQRRLQSKGETVALADGQEFCGCGVAFVPTITRPDMCARCARA